MKKFFLLPVIVFVFNLGFSSQGALKIDPFSDIEFNTDIEKQLINDFFVNKRKDYRGIFIAIDSTLTKEKLDLNKSILNQHLNKLNDKKFKKASEKKQIKIIQNYLSDNLLINYEVINNYNEIFLSNKYCEATAAALYSVILSKLNIPFIIVTENRSIYLVTWPSSSNVIIENKDPQNRIINYDYRTKSGFAKYIISKYSGIYDTLFNSPDPDQIFRNYYFPSDTLTMAELIGIQYLNYTENLLDNRKVKEAFNQLEKAYLFYKSERTGFLIFTALSAIINEIDYTKPDDFKYLYKLAKYKTFNITNDQIIAEFTRATNNILLLSNDILSYNKIYQGFSKHVSDSILLSEISYIYNYEMGRYYLSIDEPVKGNLYIDMSMKLKPNIEKSLSLYIAALAVNIRDKSPAEILELMSTQMRKYPFLYENNLYHGLLAETYLLLASENFEKKNLKEGIRYLELFEDSYNLNKKLPVSESLIVRTYSVAAVFYFKSGMYNKSKQILQTGLKFVPESNELKLRLDAF